MKAAFYFRAMARESRGMRRRLVFFVACLAVGVAAVVAVAGLAAGLDGAIRTEARQLLAADLAISGWSAPPEETVAPFLERFPEADAVLVKEMVTVVAAPRPEPAAETEPRALPSPRVGRSRLVELKAVGGGYPFYGKLELEPARPLGELLDDDTVIAAPQLLTSLRLAVGDTLKVGGKDFRIAGTVGAEPDRLGGAFSLGPRLFISPEGLERAELEQLGSRVRHKLLLELPESLGREELRALAEELDSALGPAFDVETYAEAQPALRRGIRRAERFLGLVALLSLLAGGIGVAQTVRAYLASRMDAIAVLKCLGLRPRQILALYLGQTFFLGLAGSATGIALGLAIQRLVPTLLSDVIPPGALTGWYLGPMLRGLGLGTGVALLFSLPPLLSVRRVPPARVLRRDAEPLATERWASVATVVVLLLGVFALASAQSGSLRLGAGFSAGLAAATAALAGVAWLLTRLAGKLARRIGEGHLALTQGLTALARPGAGTLGAVIALGLGVLVVLAMSLVEEHLSSRFEADLPTEAPTVFLINIQPEQWAGVRGLLEAKGAERIDSVPVVTGRFASIDGRSTEELEDEAEGGNQRWALTREQQITYLEELPEDNQILEGALWSEPGRAELSIEEEFAGWLGVSVGSEVVLDIQGVPVEVLVTSIRRVDWETFGINFYIVAEPGALDDAPQQRIAAVRLPRGEEQQTQDEVAAVYPNITLFNVREILEKVGAVIRKVGLGVQVLGGFTVLAGIAILAGAVTANSARRGREVALLKTLGMTRLGVVRVFSVEYSLIGLAAGLIGSIGGGVLAWTVITQGLEIPFELRPGPYLIALAGSMTLAVGAGLGASLRALGQRPGVVLRSE